MVMEGSPCEVEASVPGICSVPPTMNEATANGWSPWTTKGSHAGQESMMGGEFAGQRFGQLGDLGPQAVTGEISHRGRVGVAGDEGFEHQPPGHPDEVGGHRRQLDPRVFEHLFQPLDFSAPFPGYRGAGAGQIPQLPDRCRRDERSTHQTVGAQLRQPGRIVDVGLAAWPVAGVTRVDQHHVHRVFEQVVERLPVG
jgi:hypothetical protein